jgi:hypothetical protein
MTVGALAILKNTRKTANNLENLVVSPRLCITGMPLYQKDFWVYVMLPGTDLKTQQFDPEKLSEEDDVLQFRAYRAYTCPLLLSPSQTIFPSNYQNCGGPLPWLCGGFPKKTWTSMMILDSLAVL